MVSPGNDGVSKLGISGFPTKPHFLEVPCLFWVGGGEYQCGRKRLHEKTV